MSNTERTDEGEALEPDEVLGPDDALDPIDTPAPPVAYSISGTAAFALRGVAHDGGRPAEELRGVIASFAGALEEWPAFVRELFSRMYDPDGTHRLPAEALSTWGSAALGAVEQQPEWPALCSAAAVSRAVAAGAATTIAAAVAKALGLEKDKEPTAAAADPRADLLEAEAAAQAAEEQGDAPGAARARLEAQRATAAAQARRKAIDTKVQVDRWVLRGIVKAAAAEAAAAVAVIAAFVGVGFSREGPGSIQQMAPDLARKLRVDARLLAILLQAGRIRETQQGALAKGDGNVNVVGTRSTGDLSRTTGAFRGRLGTPGVVGDLAMLDLLEEQASGYQMQDRAPHERGDVGILVDRSGSMSGAREIAARALGVAAMLAALADGRRVVAGSFAGSYRGHVDCTVHAVKPGDLGAVAKALEVLCRQAGGGTDVDAAVLVAAGAMRSFPGGMREPDVLVITDGEFDPIAPAVIAQLGETPRLFGVFVDCDDGQVQRHPEFVRCWSVEDIGESFAAGVINNMRERK